MSDKAVFYTIYKTTNLVNGKVYIGKHITQNLDDGYFGSGKLLCRAIDKYGVENFRKEILHVFDNESEMNAKERELVTEEFVLQETNYNLCVGGKGGWSYVNRELPNGMFGKKQTDAQKHTAREWNRKNQKKLQKRTPARIAHNKRLAKLNKGRQHTETTKQCMSQRRRGKGSGDQNSQYGTVWITDGQKNKKIHQFESLPDGWVRGTTYPPNLKKEVAYCRQCHDLRKREQAQVEARRLYEEFLQSVFKTASEYVKAGHYQYSVVSLTQKWKKYIPEYRPNTGRGNKMDH